MPYGPNGEWLSPWEAAHGGEPYDPEKEYEENDFDRATEEYYSGRLPEANLQEHDRTNWYEPETYNWLINEAGDSDPGGGKKTDPTKVDPQIIYRDRLVGGGGGRSRGGPERIFQYPDWTPPNIQFGTFAAPSWDVTPFEYEPFNPEAQPFEADPGYEFRASEMDRSIKHAKSAQGLLSTGNTLADLMKMRGGLASQEYGNVMDRRFRKWGANRDLALDKWKTGYQSESDEFTRALTGYLTAEQAKENEWLRSRDLYTTNLGKEMGSFGLNLDNAKLNVARDTGNFGNLLSLYGLMTRNMPTYTPTA